MVRCRALAASRQTFSLSPAPIEAYAFKIFHDLQNANTEPIEKVVVLPQKSFFGATSSLIMNNSFNIKGGSCHHDHQGPKYLHKNLQKPVKRIF